jgi:hypothetical protein
LFDRAGIEAGDGRVSLHVVDEPAHAAGWRPKSLDVAEVDVPVLVGLMVAVD